MPYEPKTPEVGFKYLFGAGYEIRMQDDEDHRSFYWVTGWRPTVAWAKKTACRKFRRKLARYSAKRARLDSWEKISCQ